ncbi:DUF7504 family protein [Halarchaeum sp. P4]|uniref:DUF7504 family protein n=1 Tax=Halarchaeum sp. P4 TaxID=3421639 RepID=UPI003EC0AF82
MGAEMEGDTTEGVSAFTDRLGALKRDGCMLLLVTPPDHDAAAAACRRMLGDELLTERERLFVLTESDASDHPGTSLGKHGDPADTGVLRYHTEARSVTADSSMGSGGPSGPDTDSFAARVPSADIRGGLDALADGVEDEIGRLDARAGGLDPGELRVCVDTLDDLLAHDGTEAVHEFLHDVRDVVLAHDGMCHAHLSADVHAAPIDELGDAFDAVVEVDYDGRAKQRWHVPDLGFSTGWLAL